MFLQLVFPLTDSEDGSPAKQHHHVLRSAGPSARGTRSRRCRAVWILGLTLRVDRNDLIYSASAGRCSQRLWGKLKGFLSDSQPSCSQCSYKVKITDLGAVSSACDEEAHDKNVSMWSVRCYLLLNNIE